MYTGQCNLEEQELVEFLSFVKQLGVNGFPDEIVNNTNITMEYCVSEVQTNEKVENIFEKWSFTFRDIVKEKGNRVIIRKGNI